MAEFFYRYQEMYFSEDRVMLVEHRFPIVKHTRRGTWIEDCGRQRFVLTAARKHYACPTPESAFESYRARKRRQIRILKAQLRRAETALTLKAKGDMAYESLT